MSDWQPFSGVYQRLGPEGPGTPPLVSVEGPGTLPLVPVVGPHQLFQRLTACKDVATSWTLDTEISHATQDKCHEFIFRVLMLISRMEIGVWVVRPEVVDDIEFAFSSLETAVMADKLQSQETINNNTNRKK